MLRRTSVVDSFKIKSVVFSSIIELGDSSYVQSFSRALAVQREEELFFGAEGNFRQYSVFSIPLPIAPLESVPTVQIDNRESPIIKVNRINVIALAAGSVIHIGSSRVMQMETRIKHIRQLTDVD